MSFTFNWTGFSTPEIRGGSNDYQRTIREDAAVGGSALKGYEVNKANKEYADILDKKAKISTISARIAQLEQRNAELRNQLQGMGQVAVDAEPGPAFPSNYYGQVGNMEYPLRDMNIKTPMNISGIPVDSAF